MDAVSSIQGTMTALEIDAARAVRTVKLIADAVEMQGDMTLKLLESAFVDPDLGQHLDIRV